MTTTRTKAETNGAETPSEPVAMLPGQALDVLARIAFEFRGTRQDHVTIDQAITTLKAALNL